MIKIRPRENGQLELIMTPAGRLLAATFTKGQHLLHEVNIAVFFNVYEACSGSRRRQPR
jgi:hypothetical protein